MKPDIIIIGGGMAGAAAALAAKNKGADVILIRKGYGSTALSSGAFDILDTNRDIHSLNKRHPYRIVGEKAFSRFKDILDNLLKDIKDAGLYMDGSIKKDATLISIAGISKDTNFCQHSLCEGAFSKLKNAKILLFGIKGLTDFNPKHCCNLLRESNERNSLSIKNIDYTFLDLSELGAGNHLYPFSLAMRLDDDGMLKRFISKIRGSKKNGYTHLGFPPILGLKNNPMIVNALEESTGNSIFELLPHLPSIPGYRLQMSLDRLLNKKGVNVLIGDVNMAAIKDKRIESVSVKTKNEMLNIQARSFILATGRWAGGKAIKKNGIYEPIFDLPIYEKERVAEIKDVANYLDSYVLESHPLLSVGIRVNSRLQPLNGDDDIAYKNLFAAGAILGGYNYLTDRCGLGVAFLTGHLSGKYAAEEM